MAGVILHHYPQSPVAEKVRVVMGIKGLAWNEVIIPRLPPKPDLMPLTAGYRQTPVMQVGANIFCDTLCIIRELERCFPEPSLFPDGETGRGWAMAGWTDRTLLKQTIGLVLGDSADRMPKEFFDDRVRLYFGEGVTLDDLVRAVERNREQLRVQLAWAENMLRDGRAFLTGEAPGLQDALLYYIVWFIRGRYGGAGDLLGGFERLCAWEERVRDLGHGDATEIEAAEALTIARDATPEASLAGGGPGPQGPSPGTPARITPLEADASPIEGPFVAADAQTVVIRHENERAGRVFVHFPRFGYHVEAL